MKTFPASQFRNEYLGTVFPKAARKVPAHLDACCPKNLPEQKNKTLSTKAAKDGSENSSEFKLQLASVKPETAA
jgi:hypothetical protein